MNVHELTRDQLIQLKQIHLTKLNEEGTLNHVPYGDPNDETGLSYDELANADTLVPDTVVYDEYAGYDFMPDDFSVTDPDVLTIEVSDIIWDIDDDDVIERFGSLLDDNELPYTSRDFGLPSNVILQMSKAKYKEMVEDGEDIQKAMADYIDDRLVNEYAFCVTNRTWRFIHINPPDNKGGRTTKIVKTKKTTEKPAKIKTDTKAVKIPLMDWLMSEEGDAFSREIIRYVARDTSFNKLRLLTLKEFAKDGWVHDWVLNGETDCFPFIDRDTRGDIAFDRLFSAMEENSDNEAILLTYGPDFGDNRDDYAFECLKVICDDPNYPPHN